MRSNRDPRKPSAFQVEEHRLTTRWLPCGLKVSPSNDALMREEREEQREKRRDRGVEGGKPVKEKPSRAQVS